MTTRLEISRMFMTLVKNLYFGVPYDKENIPTEDFRLVCQLDKNKAWFQRIVHYQRSAWGHFLATGGKPLSQAK